MQVAPRPKDELERLRSLLNLALLDTEPEAAFDAAVACAAAATGAPIALISLVDDERQWFKARHGLDATETHRDVAFCAHAILDDRPLVVADARADARFCCNPLVTGAPHVAAYIGAPLKAPDGHRIGTLCAIDRKPHAWTPREIAELEALSALVTEMLRLRHNLLEARTLTAQVSQLSRDLELSGELFEEASGLACVGGWRYDIGAPGPVWTREVRRIHEVDDAFEPTLDTAISFYSEEAQERLRLALARAIETGDPYSLDLPLTTARGRHIWVRTSGKVMYENGKPVALVGAFQDITDQTLREQELDNARARAELATRSKSIFLANMSHEIRTPLNGVTGLAGALASTPLTGRQREMVELIRSSGATLDRLLSDILDASKIEAGRLDLVRQPFDLRSAVEHAAQLMQVRADNKGLGFRIGFGETARGVFLGDVVRLRQIVSNLTSNAVKFTEAGGVAIHVDVDDPEAGGPSMVRITVEDTGIGFTDVTARTLFTRFVQAEETYSGSREGAGLGLAICRELSRLMGGDITASSVSGSGSRFVVTLPMDRAMPLAEHDRDLSRVTPSPSVEAQVAEGPALRVLVAEDNPTNQRVACLILEAFGFDVTLVGNGRQAVDAHAEQAFDLILMDTNMPEMDGLDAVRAIRRVEQAQGGRRTPIAMLSAYAMREHIERAIAAGCDAHISKPVSPQSLRAGMNEALDAARRAGGQTAAA